MSCPTVTKPQKPPKSISNMSEQIDPKIEKDKIYNCDCLEGMKHIPNASIDAIICDLPYGTTANKWDSIIPLEPLWAEYKRVLKHQGSVLLFGSEPFSTSLRMSNLDWFKYDWIWQKNRPTGFQHAKNMPLKDFEIVSVFSAAGMGHIAQLKDNRMTYNPQGIKRVDIQMTASKNKFGTVVHDSGKYNGNGYTQEYGNFPTMTLKFDTDEDGWHPTQKPVDLLRYLIRTYSNEGDTILDNCMGSGTTAVACIKEKRHFIGFELNKDYYDKACRRIDAERRQLSLF